MNDTSIYLDFASATPVDATVFEATKPYLSDHFHNPSAEYEPARKVRAELELARQKIASIIGAKPTEVIFTAGGTEANNLAIHGAMAGSDGANVVISAIEHDSVRRPAGVYDCRQIDVDSNGILSVESLVASIDDSTVLVSVMYANNEIGTVQPIRRISQIIKDIRDCRTKNGSVTPLLLHVDAAQAGNYLDLHVHRLGADMMTLNGGKIYGPKQTGALYVRSGVELEPHILGGGQEKGLRSGTENVAGAIGLATALDLAQQMRRDEVARLHGLQQHVIKLLGEKIPQANINGSSKYRLPNNIHITIPGQDNERLQMALDQVGICVATGSACSASHAEPSHVLQAIGMDELAIRASLRVTMGRTTTKADIDHFISGLLKVLA